ncbi:hypothetical protein LN042_36530 [Kitasatospora sp. RB6PN24]|uniref:hypothetical protein n=1 Tax=Kitasatospora humi TaxID=2893891 RepID=UPI001E31F99E|nr:hypothetical protein [Kitasatospora humi]MCC9312499.1 hypothetical protein [Kitasatospora humi]
MGKRLHRANEPWNWSALRELNQRLYEAYGDVDHPRRSFVRTVARQEPYRDAVSELSASSPTLVDDTDVNCDVAFSYIIETPDGPLFLRLSMVGPYAMFARDRDGALGHVIASESDCTSDLERDVVRALLRHGIMLLSEAQLVAPAELNLPDLDQVSVYSALFAPEEEAPRAWSST